MAVNINRRDYSLGGPEDKRAQEKGIASAEWYASPIPRQKMKELMKRKDGPAIRDTIIWFALLGILGYLAYLSWGTWWAIPAFAAYGAVYALPGNSRWHEASHGTMFKTPWMNEVIYQIASFMNLFPATLGAGAMPAIIPTPILLAVIPRSMPQDHRFGECWRRNCFA